MTLSLACSPVTSIRHVLAPKIDWIATPLRSALNRFLRQSDGTITVEVVLWLPLYAVFFSLIADVSSMMHSRSVSMRIIEDANRHAVTGYLTTEQEVETQVTNQMQTIAGGSNIQVTWGTDDISTVVTYPASDVQIVGLISIFSDIDLTVRSFNRFEI